METSNTNFLHVVMNWLLFTIISLVPINIMAKSANNSPVEVVTKYYELQQSMTPDTFAGTNEELLDLQSDLINESMDLISYSEFPLLQNEEESIKIIYNEDFKISLESIELLEIVYWTGIETETYLIDNPETGDFERGTYIHKWWWTYFKYQYNYRYEDFFEIVKKRVLITNAKRRAEYIKYQKLSNLYNKKVSGINIVDYAILNNGNTAIVEYYSSAGMFNDIQDRLSRNSDTQYMYLSKIDDKWYIDFTPICIYKEDSYKISEVDNCFKQYQEMKVLKANKATDDIVASEVELVTPENFDKFIRNFYDNESFQKERIIFPIGRTYDMWNDTYTSYTAESWMHISGYGTHKISNNQYGGEWATDGGASGGSILFELGDDNKWYLVKYETY